MDFAVATIRCFDTVKVHHDKRWLRQQRLLLISTLEILNCPWPASGTPAMLLFELFSTPISTTTTTTASSSKNNNTSNDVPPAAVPISDSLENNNNSPTKSNNNNNTNKSTPLHLLRMSEEMNQLEKRYQTACEICNSPKISFEDIKKIMNPSKSNFISQVVSTSLKGDDHMCINFKNDHPYYYNTPLAIQITKVIRSRFIAWSSARLVEGNFAQNNNSNNNGNSAATIMIKDIDIHTPQTMSASPTTSNENSSFDETSNMSNVAIHQAKSTSSSPNIPASPNVTSPRQLASTTNNSNSNNENASFASNPTTNPEMGFSRISELFQAGVIELPTNSDIDHLQNQIMLLTKALDWVGDPSSVFEPVTAAVKKLSDDTASWSNFEASVKSGNDAQAKKQQEIDDAPSPNSRSRAQSRLVVGVPSRAIEFRRRFDELRAMLTDTYLVSGSKEIVEPEKSFSEKLAFWRSPRRIPQFEDPEEAELVAELALQYLLYRSPATLKNLWVDISVAYHEEMEHFGFNCRMLSAPCVPFGYFGIPDEFENVRFDLVRYHLQTLMSCKTPSAMLNAIVAAIKSVIVCIKAKYVLSKRWARAFSEPPTLDLTNPSFNSTTISNAAAAGASLSSLNNTTTSVGGAYWSRDEIDQIANEAKKHSLYNTDDILPIFIYIVVYCDLPQLLLYHRFLENLNFEGEASERAFYVTVFFSAIQWILDWKKPKSKNNKENIKKRSNSTKKEEKENENKNEQGNNTTVSSNIDDVDVEATKKKNNNTDDESSDLDIDDDDDFGGEFLSDEVWEQAAAMALVGTSASLTSPASLAHLHASGLKEENLLPNGEQQNSNTNNNTTMANFGAAVDGMAATTREGRTSSVMRGPFSTSFLGRKM